MSKKILHIINSLEIGGAEKLLITLINNLPPAYEQHLILLSNTQNTLLKEISKSCKVNIFNIRLPYGLPKAIISVKKYCIQNKIDIIHTQLYWPGIIARLAATSKIKIVNCIQAISSDSTYKINKIAYWLEKITYKKRHIIIAVSNCVLQDFDKWIGIKGKNYVLYNLIDQTFFSLNPQHLVNNQSGSVKLIAVGNLRWQKNYEYLLDAFKSIKNPLVTLDIYGEGDLRNKFEDIINENDLKVTLKGHSQNISEKLIKYNFFVMSSLFEGFSLALMEAMACGLIPILSDVPVLKEAGGNAAIYFNLDDTKSFVSIINNIKEGKYNIIEMSAAAKERANHLCDIKKYIETIIDIYNDN